MAHLLPSSVARLMVILASLITLSSGQLMSGFGEEDYSGVESQNGTLVTVTKIDTNVGDLFLNIRALTVEDFDNSVGCENLPVELQCNVTDPAESGDFDNNVIQIVFPASDQTDEIQVFIPFFDDDINEGREFYFITVTVDQQSNEMDRQSIQLVRNGVAQIFIDDDDDITLSFEMADYAVAEGAGPFDDVVFVVKNDGMVTEQVLPILVSPQSGSATEGPMDDYTINIPLPLLLEFPPTESRLAVNIATINDDDILEPRENFNLQLAIPVNPPQGYSLQVPSTAVIHIDDDEQGRVGLEREMYTANESDGFVEICFEIFEPMNASLIDNTVFASFRWRTNNGTAFGEGVDYDSIVPAFNTEVFLDRGMLRRCFNITIIDDSLEEGTEEFTVNIILDGSDQPILAGNFTFDPINATIIILDDDEGNETTTEQTITEETTTGMGGDPHYSILLPTGQNLCYSVQGEHGFTFNLISNNKMQMNAMFVPDAQREEVTWIGALGIVLKNVRYKNLNKTKIRFVASENKLYIGEEMSLNAGVVNKLEFSNGKLKISEAERNKRSQRLDVEVDLKDIGLKFTVRFVKKSHLDMFWNEVIDQPRNSHGMIGQFFRSGVEIDETRRLLLLPTMEPVPVMRKPIWHFMEREEAEEKLCWVAMNPGYQGKKLLEGHYLDYLVNDVLSTKFKFSPSKRGV